MKPLSEKRKTMTTIKDHQIRYEDLSLNLQTYKII